MLNSSVLAAEEFDKLLFEFGLELDEDVGIYLVFQIPSTNVPYPDHRGS